MKFTEELKKTIGEEAYKKLEDKIQGKELYLLDPKNYFPKEKVSELLEEKKSFKETIENLQKEETNFKTKITELENKLKTKEDGSKTTEELLESFKLEIESMKTELQKKDEAIAMEKKQTKLREALLSNDANPKYVKFLQQEFDETDENKEFDERLKAVKDKNKEMFGEFKIEGNPPPAVNDLNFSKEEKEYKELMSKDTLTSLETSKAMELAQKIKEKKED